ncbi:MAG: hypothetical protein P4L53_09795 [Candidatus Obscuribacterales bacterium]|nr:hypothetical protein [Candidatus Obscuribacterales bacterium]
MLKLVSCVVRSFNGNNELVRIEDSFNHRAGERVVTGRMTSYTIKSGPSNSHNITVWAIRGPVLYTDYGAISAQSLEERFTNFENEVAEAA